MRVLICGDRKWSDKKPIRAVIDTLPLDAFVITGGARGADTIARELAQERGIRTITYEAEWSKLGLAAGPVRNKTMLYDANPDIVYAFHSDIEQSKGTKNMVKQAQKKGVKVVIIGC